MMTVPVTHFLLEVHRFSITRRLRVCWALRSIPRIQRVDGPLTPTFAWPTVGGPALSPLVHLTGAKDFFLGCDREGEYASFVQVTEVHGSTLSQ